MYEMTSRYDKKLWSELRGVLATDLRYVVPMNAYTSERYIGYVNMTGEHIAYALVIYQNGIPTTYLAGGEGWEEMGSDIKLKDLDDALLRVKGYWVQSDSDRKAYRLFNAYRILKKRENNPEIREIKRGPPVDTESLKSIAHTDAARFELHGYQGSTKVISVEGVKGYAKIYNTGDGKFRMVWASYFGTTPHWYVPPAGVEDDDLECCLARASRAWQVTTVEQREKALTAAVALMSDSSSAKTLTDIANTSPWSVVGQTQPLEEPNEHTKKGGTKVTKPEDTRCHERGGLTAWMVQFLEEFNSFINNLELDFKYHYDIGHTEVTGRPYMTIFVKVGDFNWYCTVTEHTTSSNSWFSLMSDYGSFAFKRDFKKKRK